MIGGGIVGASVLYHLAKFGWNDVALVERSELTSGSTWHAAAGFHAMNADPNIAALQDYTINLYPVIEEESGQSCGLHITGGMNIATDPNRWEQLQAGWATFKAIGIESSRLISRDEVRKLTGGVIRTDDVLGGLWDDNEGYLDPNGSTYAFANAAKKYGAKVIVRNRVLELNQRPDSSWNVVTEKGTIHAENVINVGGLWAKQVGLMAGVDLPVTPMEHHYLVTETLESLKALPGELPVIADLDALTYTRQERDGLLIGVYERNPKTWCMDGAPWDYGMDLIPEDVDRIAEELALGFERFPGLEEVGIRRWVNGAFTFSPDGNPLVGPVGPRGYWVACGIMAGFSQGGGVGKSLAEWMIHGEPENDIWGMDVARFGPHMSNKEFIRQTASQFYSRRMAITYPNEQLPAGRKLRTAGAHTDMEIAGAHWGALWGLEVPLYFKPQGFEEPGTMRRSTAFPLVGAECRTVQEAAGLLDLTSFARYEITGPNANAWLDRMLPNKLPAPGRVKLAPMLSHNGRLKGDLTCFNWGDGTYWLMGSYYLRQFHMRWFNHHLEDGVFVRDVADAVTGFSINGPNATEILERVSDTDLSDLKMMRCKTADLGLFRIKIARLSLMGEVAYEINCSAPEHASMRRMLLEAGADLGLRDIGFEALMSLRLEKSIGVWNAEFTQLYTPAMTGMDYWVATEKGDFIGRDALMEAVPPTQLITMLEVDATDADCRGFEPVWKGDALVGMTTSGGYGHRMKKSYALALLDREMTEVGTELHVHVVGEKRGAKVIEMSPYDPGGSRMRA